MNWLEIDNKVIRVNCLRDKLLQKYSQFLLSPGAEQPGPCQAHLHRMLPSRIFRRSLYFDQMSLTLADSRGKIHVLREAALLTIPAIQGGRTMEWS